MLKTVNRKHCFSNHKNDHDKRLLVIMPFLIESNAYVSNGCCISFAFGLYRLVPRIVLNSTYLYCENITRHPRSMIIAVTCLLRRQSKNHNTAKRKVVVLVEGWEGGGRKQ